MDLLVVDLKVTDFDFRLYSPLGGIQALEEFVAEPGNDPCFGLRVENGLVVWKLKRKEGELNSGHLD